MAQLLSVSEGTVKTQVQRIFTRLGVHDRMEFAMARAGSVARDGGHLAASSDWMTTG